MARFFRISLCAMYTAVFTNKRSAKWGCRKMFMVENNIGCVKDNNLFTEYSGQQKKNIQEETSSMEMVGEANNTRSLRSQNLGHPSVIVDAAKDIDNYPVPNTMDQFGDRCSHANISRRSNCFCKVNNS